MKSQSKLLFILFLLPAMLFASNEPHKGKYTKEKKIKKEYTVNANAGLHVDNSYGNIEITTWNENRTVIEVHILTNGNDEAEVQKRLEEITVEFSGNGSLVSAKTKFGNKKDSSWNFWGKKNKNISIEVNYSIKLPVTNSVDLDNNYGAINLNRLEGNAKINCDYGQLIIGELMADNNYLNFDYTSKSTIAYMKSGKIDADYSGFTLDKAGSLELNADYTNSEIGEVNEINYNCDYGKVVVRKAGNIMGRGDYVTNRIGTVNGSLNLNTDYGSIVVDQLSGSAKNVTINADYTGIKLGFASNYSFDFAIQLSYCGIKGEELVTVTRSSSENSQKMYSGYHGKQNSGNTINIDSDYGGVTFFRN
jgi:hypothetical protein